MTMLITRSWLYILKDRMDNPKSLQFCKITMHIANWNAIETVVHIMTSASHT